MKLNTQTPIRPLGPLPEGPLLTEEEQAERKAIMTPVPTENRDKIYRAGQTAAKFHASKAKFKLKRQQQFFRRKLLSLVLEG